MKPTDEMIKRLEKYLENCTTAEDLFWQRGVIKNLVHGFSEQILEAEMTHHLGYEKVATEGQNSGNSRNGKSSKTVQSDTGEKHLDIPRDRNGTFEPILMSTDRDFNFAEGKKIEEIILWQALDTWPFPHFRSAKPYPATCLLLSCREIYQDLSENQNYCKACN